MADSRPNDPAGSLTPPSTNLHAPWRLAYLEKVAGEEKREGGLLKPTPRGPGSGSFLRDYWLDPAGDEQNSVVFRVPDGSDERDGGMILLNRFPYANGHLLVALGEARPTLMDYSAAQRAALWRLVDVAAELMTRALEPQGMNIGVNQGRAAGAGVPQHLHVHLVPRWSGDVNFMSVVGGVRVIPASLDAMAGKYRDAVKQIGSGR